jgi:biotin carboxyl carrier protein
MDVKNLKKLYETMEDNGFAELELGIGNEKIKMQLDSQYVAVPLVLEEPEVDCLKKTELEIRSDKVGNFSFDGSSFKAGDKIEKGALLGTIKGISFQDKVKCLSSGKIAKIAVVEGEVIDYGKLLFVVEID